MQRPIAKNEYDALNVIRKHIAVLDEYNHEKTMLELKKYNSEYAWVSDKELTLLRMHANKMNMLKSDLDNLRRVNVL